MSRQLSLMDGLEKWYKSVEKSTSKMSNPDRWSIEDSVATVFMKHLQEVTSAKHRSTHNDGSYGHAADNISMSHDKSGSGYYQDSNHVRVGWKKRYHAMNMMRVNDGTKKIIGDHFVDNLREDPAVQQEMLEAAKKAYNRVIKKNQEKEGDEDYC